MSTRQEILDGIIQSRRLIPLKPLSPLAQCKRAILVTPEIFDLLEGNVVDEIDEERYGRLRADLETFVVEDDLYHKYIYWLTPRHDHVWEIRSVADEPTLRVLGRFADYDVFVALTIEERSELGEWESESWKRARRTTIQRWSSAVNLEPYKAQEGTNQDDFFSGAIPGKYWKK